MRAADTVGYTVKNCILGRNGVTGQVSGCRSFGNKQFDYELNKKIK